MSRIWVSFFMILGLFPHDHKTVAAVPSITCFFHGSKKKPRRNLSLELGKVRYFPETFKFLWPELGTFALLSCKRHRENDYLPLSDAIVAGTLCHERGRKEWFWWGAVANARAGFYYNSTRHTPGSSTENEHPGVRDDRDKSDGSLDSPG